MSIQSKTYDLTNVKLGLEMLVTILPIHDQDDLDNLSSMFKGIEWGKAAYAMGADIWQAILRGGDDAVDTLDQYLECIKEIIAYMQGLRPDLPAVIRDDPELAQAFVNRRKVIEIALNKKVEAADV